MYKQSVVLFTFLGLLVLSTARAPDGYPQDFNALSNKDSDFVSRINSTDLPKLASGEYLIQFEDPCPGNPLFDYKNQLFFVYLPTNFNSAANVSLGVIAFISHTNQWGMWTMYKNIFDTRNLIYFVPQNAGNMIEDIQRHAAGAAGIYYLQNVLPIDPARIYTSGLSGGGRLSCQMGWDNGTLISGTVAIVGCDYKRRVNFTSGADPSYGFYNSYPLPDDVLAATYRVVIITGSNDFCEDNLNDIYYYGIVEDGLTGWLLDIPGMGHEMADYETYDQALGLLDDNPPKCQYPCRNCTLNRSNCTGCFSSLYMSLYIDNSTGLGSCIQYCPSGTYAYDSLCHTSCPDGTEVSNDGDQDTCVATSEEETSTVSD